MRVMVTGGSGFIGRALVEQLCAGGHSVVVLSRDAGKTRAQLPGVDDVYSWRDCAAPPPRQALLGCEGIVNLAGETVRGRWTSAKRRGIKESRIVGTKSLVTAVAELPASERPSVLVSGSATGYYGSRGDELLDETSPPDDSFLAEVCREWEAAATSMEALGVRVTLLRTGIVLHPKGGALAAMLPLFRYGLGGPLGGGRQWWSWIHRDDVVGMIALALEAPELSGPMNVVAPNSVRQGEFARRLGRALGRPSVLPTPAPALRLALGGFAGELLASRRVVPQRATDFGYSFRHPTLDSVPLTP